MTNIISYILDGQVACPEIGLLEARRKGFLPIRLDRFAVDIGGDRAPVIGEALSCAFREGACLIVLHVEDEKALSSAPYMRRFLNQKLGVSTDAGVSMLGRSVLMLNPSVRREDFERTVARLVQAQQLFVIIFGFREPREISVDWDSIYAGKQVSVADYLRPGEVALFRSGLRSQDVFELSAIRLA